jgi:WhiB family redox-sensing transcriptional regulator
MSAWQELAACAGHPEPDLWHPGERGMTRDKADAITDAKAVCASCPVRHACLNDALENGYEGIWGGTTDAERGQVKEKGPRFRTADNVAFVLEQLPMATAREVGERLGLERDAILRAITRAGRFDLRDRLNRNAELAGHNVTGERKATA